jgi:hypothetical protein
MRAFFCQRSAGRCGKSPKRRSCPRPVRDADERAARGSVPNREPIPSGQSISIGNFGSGSDHRRARACTRPLVSCLQVERCGTTARGVSSENEGQHNSRVWIRFGPLNALVVARPSTGPDPFCRPCSSGAATAPPVPLTAVANCNRLAADWNTAGGALLFMTSPHAQVTRDVASGVECSEPAAC